MHFKLFKSRQHQEPALVGGDAVGPACGPGARQRPHQALVLAPVLPTGLGSHPGDLGPHRASRVWEAPASHSCLALAWLEQHHGETTTLGSTGSSSRFDGMAAEQAGKLSQCCVTPVPTSIP